MFLSAVGSDKCDYNNVLIEMLIKIVVKGCDDDFLLLLPFILIICGLLFSCCFFRIGS